MADVKSKNRVRAAKALHEKNTQVRKAEGQTLKASYLKEKDNLVLVDILEKAKSFAAYNLKLAQDGIGARKTGYKLENGQAEVENYFFKPSERVSSLDKAAGLQQIIDYIERQLAEPQPKPKA